jgi:AraC-like DNA-binding protein
MLNLLNALAAGSAFLLAFLMLVLRQQVNRIANRWLSLFFFLLGLSLLDGSLKAMGIYKNHPAIIGLADLFILALAPALYLGVGHFVKASKRFRPQQLWHFLILLLFIIYRIPFLFSAPAIKWAEVEGGGQPLGTTDQLIDWLTIGQVMVYVLLSFVKLYRHRRQIHNIVSDTAAARLDWLLYFLWGIGLLALVWLMELRLLPFEHNKQWNNFFYLLAIYIVSYYALRQGEVYPVTESEAQAVDGLLAAESLPPILKKTLLSEEVLVELKARLLTKMTEDKPYLDPDLNLAKLAAQMQLSLHELSELINKGFGENFAQLVNRYRVAESQRLLLAKKHENLNMLGIAFEAGFNSKTAFNTAFKKHTGVSPTQFVQQQP